MSIADHDIITDRYFFPRPASVGDAQVVDVGEAQLACYFHDGGHDLTVVHFHGNGEVVADYIPGFANQLDQLGVNTFFAEYRGYGGSTGTPRLGAMLDDVGAIREAVGVPDEKLLVFGRSVGSIYAIEFAARFPEISGLIVESGIADVLERILLRASPQQMGTTLEAMTDEFENLFDHRKKLEAFDGPALFLHAEYDHLVDKSHAERNAEWTGSKTRLVIFEEGDHNSIFFVNRQRYLDELDRFFELVRAVGFT